MYVWMYLSINELMHCYIDQPVCCFVIQLCDLRPVTCDIAVRRIDMASSKGRVRGKDFGRLIERVRGSLGGNASIRSVGQLPMVCTCRCVLRQNNQRLMYKQSSGRYAASTVRSLLYHAAQARKV